mgnify:CR=1 FL=1
MRDLLIKHRNSDAFDLPAVKGAFCELQKLVEQGAETVPDHPQDIAAMNVEKETYMADIMKIATLPEEERAAAAQGEIDRRRRPQATASRPTPY